MFSETKTCPRHGKISYMLWYTKARVWLWEIINSLGNRAAIPPKIPVKPVLQWQDSCTLLSACCSSTQAQRFPCPGSWHSWTQVCSSSPHQHRDWDMHTQQALASEVTVTHCRAVHAGDTRACLTAFLSSNLIFQASSMRPGRSSCVTEVLALPLRRHRAPQAARPDTTHRINSCTSFFPQTSPDSQGHNTPHHVFPQSLQ